MHVILFEKKNEKEYVKPFNCVVLGRMEWEGAGELGEGKS